jgi:hypothetical protein
MQTFQQKYTKHHPLMIKNIENKTKGKDANYESILQKY